MDYFHVKNYEKFQHYKDRNPPWIKLHRTIFNDYEFSCMQDASKLQLILIWMLASQLENKIPYDAEWVKKQIGVSAEVDLKEFETKGFITIDSSPLAECTQKADGETEAYKEEAYKEESKHNITLGGENSKKRILSKNDYVKFFNRFETIWGIYPHKMARHKAIEVFFAHVRKEGMEYYRELAFAIRCEKRAQWNAVMQNIRRSPPPGYIFFGTGYKDYIKFYKAKRIPLLWVKRYKL